MQFSSIRKLRSIYAFVNFGKVIVQNKLDYRYKTDLKLSLETRQDGLIVQKNGLKTNKNPIKTALYSGQHIFHDTKEIKDTHFNHLRLRKLLILETTQWLDHQK